MRVIAGTRRSLPLKSVPGLLTRPTTDRIKETLFNILNPYLSESRFLDLFAGTGGIGIEALSRGASYAVFVDNDRACEHCIKDNLTFTKFTAISRVLSKDVLLSLKELERTEESPFDLVFLDPPYESDISLSVFRYLQSSKLITDDSLIIFETSIDKKTDDFIPEGFTVIRQKKYKTNQHLFIQRKT